MGDVTATQQGTGKMSVDPNSGPSNNVGTPVRRVAQESVSHTPVLELYANVGDPTKGVVKYEKNS